MKVMTLVAASMLALPIAANAQGVPRTSDDLVHLLQPRAGGPGRGIVPPSSGSAAYEAPALRSPAALRPAYVPHAAMPQREQHATLPRPVAGSAAAPAAAQAGTEAQAEGGLASVNMQVQFQTGSDRLSPAAAHTLDMLGRALADPRLAAYKFRIEGHTDAVGSPDYNQALSDRRAAAVTEYVASHFGVERARLTAVGLGQSQMLVPTADGVPEPRNRRVQIVNVGS